MIDSWLNAVNDGKMVGVVIVYFKKAFDFVDHQILLTKLKLYSIQNGTLLWFINYLSQRRQQVVMNSSNSDFKPVSSGIPQGSFQVHFYSFC